MSSMCNIKHKETCILLYLYDGCVILNFVGSMCQLQRFFEKSQFEFLHFWRDSREVYWRCRKISSINLLGEGLPVRMDFFERWEQKNKHKELNFDFGRIRFSTNKMQVSSFNKFCSVKWKYRKYNKITSNSRQTTIKSCLFITIVYLIEFLSPAVPIRCFQCFSANKFRKFFAGFFFFFITSILCPSHDYQPILFNHIAKQHCI